MLHLGRVVSLFAIVGVFAAAACSSSGRPSASKGTAAKKAPEPEDPVFGGTVSNETATDCKQDPANYDAPGNNCDDDGDGVIDNEPAACDSSVTATGTAEDFARALGICDRADAKGYGLVSAKYTRGYGRPEVPKTEQHGILSKFGNVIRPREGSKLGVLSTGYAQEYNGEQNMPFGGEASAQGQTISFGKDWWNYAQKPTPKGNGTVPPGFPKAVEGCEQAPQTNDVIDLKLELKVPPNATGFKFDFNFFSGEWPAYICSPFNDGFIAYLTAEGFNNGQPGNVSFDSKNAPISVNNSFFDRCTPNVPIGCAPGASPATSVCPGGDGELAGTGFGMPADWCEAYGSKGKPSVNGGATGWLTSQAPVKPGETFTLEFIIWDTGDGFLDSSVLLDNFRWVAETVAAPSTERPR